MLKAFLLFSIANTLLKLLFETYCYIRASIFNPTLWKKVENTWVVVTGATDGIGKELALQISKKKMKLCIVGRNPQKLQDLSNELSLNAKEVKIIEFDYEKDENYELFKDMNVGLLINNAGMSSKHPSYFYEDTVKEILQVNLKSTMLITKIIIENMVKSKFGYVINVGSMLGETPSPFLSTYCATKAAIKKWSESLHYELKKHSVHVECVLPGLVCTKMSSIKKPQFFIPSASHFAKRMLSTIGYSRENFPYFPHLLQNFALHLFPVSFISNLLCLHLKTVRRLAIVKKK